MERHIDRIALDKDIKWAILFAKQATPTKRAQVRLIVKAILEKYRMIDAKRLDFLVEKIGVTTGYFQKALRIVPWIGLTYNGTRHYRMIVDGPVRRWSMCIYKAVDDRDKEEFIRTLEYKAYEKVEADLPLPFEYIDRGDSICWLEPCDSDQWELAYQDRVRRKALFEEERTEDYHEQGKADDHLLRELLSTLETRGASTEKKVRGGMGTRRNPRYGKSGLSGVGNSKAVRRKGNRAGS